MDVCHSRIGILDGILRLRRFATDEDYSSMKGESMKTYNERVAHSQATIASAMEYSIKNLKSFIVALNQVGRKGSVKNPSYTKNGPGRYHRVRTKREIREEQELKAKKLQQRLEAENLVNHAQA